MKDLTAYPLDVNTISLSADCTSLYMYIGGPRQHNGNSNRLLAMPTRSHVVATRAKATRTRQNHKKTITTRNTWPCIRGGYTKASHN
eukprot:scaffold163549_cov31-Tisochrysis_lutea.AAC.2